MESKVTSLETTFEETLFELIPQTKNFGIQFTEIGETELVVRGSYALNKNHLDIVFGGSIAAISITTAWSLLKHNIQRLGLAGNLVIKQQEIKFLLPVHADFDCIATLPSAETWAQFVADYRDKGRARMTVQARIVCQTKTTSTFEGVFVLYQ
ncbi:YiiD C-terminal domain-containing protein [Methylophilus sp. TWE2]|jgi:thioesterase domain-containing protein|uniref:YiiD C-terminal domain-containing protein n=1 Tax=Methylophilus sp. TWE2 TaxID=1662285 RepID=UPI000ABA8553|nr:YiiD C-terminal domain-containing protein [Methylophilus sp. TWE2]